MSNYTPAFCVVPYRILYLEGLQLSYLKVYELLFQFYNHGKECFLSNQKITERTGLADSTIRESLAFFEKKGEIKRIYKGKKRYILINSSPIEIESVDNSPSFRSINDQPAAISAPNRCQVGGLPAAKSAHNNNNININNINKSFCIKDQKKNNKARHSFANNIDQINKNDENRPKIHFWGPEIPSYNELRRVDNKIKLIEESHL